MKYINVIKKEANLNLLKTIPNSLPTINGSYKGNTAPCIVKEDADGNVLSVYTNSDEYIASLLSLDEQKQAKIKQLHDKYQKMYSDYLAQYPKREVDSFAVKQAEAIAYNLDNTAPTPVIDALIKTSGDTKSDYVASVLAKVTALAGQEGQMVKIRDSIKACTTQEDLDAIVV